MSGDPRIKCCNGMDPSCDGLDVCAARAWAEVERLQALVADYENGINWHTTCTNCAKLLNDNYDQYCEIERLRAALALADQMVDAMQWAFDPSLGEETHDTIFAAWQDAQKTLSAYEGARREI